MSTQNPEPGSPTDPSTPAAAQTAAGSERPATASEQSVAERPGAERDILSEDTVQQDIITTADGVGADPVVDDRRVADRDDTASDAGVRETRPYQPHTPQRAYSNIDFDDDTSGTPTSTATTRQADTGAHPYPAAAYEPVARSGATETATAAETEQQQAFPLYVQAPSEPEVRGNRGFGILIGLLGTIIFAALYAAAVAGLQLVLEGDGTFVENLIQIATSWPFLMAAAGFFLAWVVTATIVNRSGWVHWVLGGFIIGLVVFLAWVGGFLIQERAWTLSVDEILAEVTGVAFTFGPVLAFVVAREIPVWLGGWIAARGRKVREANLEARAEYERVLEAGPTTAR
ncbi:hypothetical protein ITJ66_06445 [Plantibacter sp. VKM Ac-2885]|uniref:hypothetical protein n=1 Tax=Plantibacter sp. VKM Ac-2885 TaxID=2783828 RepID=UPI00188CBD5A|nr:hypothetical protein [Plantibacter sp. VKM Ac-2885]MBF4512123.1 hypothetical protein [Plantibacter sp. VKM Ac-2885]